MNADKFEYLITFVKTRRNMLSKLSEKYQIPNSEHLNGYVEAYDEILKELIRLEQLKPKTKET